MGGIRHNASGEPMDSSGALTYGLRVGLFMLGAAHVREVPAGPLMIGIFITPDSTAIMGSVEPRRFGLASGMAGAMRTIGMAVSRTTVALIFSLLMGDAAINRSALPDFLACMQLGLTAFAVFCCLGIIVSAGRGKRQSAAAESEPPTSHRA